MKPWQWRRIGRHIKDCFSVKAVRSSQWRSVWVLPERRYLRVGRGSACFIVWRCNCSDCPAAFAVREDYVLDRMDLPRL